MKGPMTMARWRPETWAFIIFNVVMVGLVLAVFGSVGSQTSVHDQIGVLFLGLGLAIFIWPIGLLVLAVAWLRNRPPPGPATPSDVRSVTGSDAHAVLTEAAAIVAERNAHGKSLVEAAWMSRQRSWPDDPLLLSLAFGDPSVHLALWPDDEDAMDAVLARVPGVEEQDGPY